MPFLVRGLHMMSSRSQLYNNPENCVDEALQGLVELSSGKLHLVGNRIVIQANFDRSKVALISLGGSGHEPAHAGYVGVGMLAAAIAGNVFASPPPSDILECITSITGIGGCILILKNYTGDIVNAGIARDKARANGLQVEILVSDDDCATKTTSASGARGLAGTLFLHKVLGTLAEEGRPLHEIFEVGNSVRQRIFTMGLSFNTCALPGQERADKTISFGSAELGLGIHGESGVSSLPVAPTSRDAAKLVLDSIFDIARRERGGDVATLINNLGGLSNLEMLVFSKDVMEGLRQRVATTTFVATGTLMTSLDSAGASVSLLFDVSEEELRCLKTRTDAFGWPASSPTTSSPQNFVKATTAPDKFQPATTAKRSRTVNSPAVDPKWVDAIKEICPTFRAAAMVVLLNKLDSIAGDGDTGNSMRSVSSMLEQELYSRSPRTCLDMLELATSVAERAGGSIGGVMSVFFGAASTIAESDQFDWGAAWKAARLEIELKTGSKKGLRSLVDALFPALEHYHEGVASMAHHARVGADSTKDMVGKIGRAAYVSPDKYKGSNDAGAEAVALFFESLRSQFE